MRWDVSKLLTVCEDLFFFRWWLKLLELSFHFLKEILGNLVYSFSFSLLFDRYERVKVV